MLQREVSDTSKWAKESRLECMEGERKGLPERSQPPRAKLWPDVPTAAWVFFAASDLELKFKVATPRPARAMAVARVFRVLFEWLAGNCRTGGGGGADERKDTSRHFFLIETSTV